MFSIPVYSRLCFQSRFVQVRRAGSTWTKDERATAPQRELDTNAPSQPCFLPKFR
jgi:hypothetical protein